MFFNKLWSTKGPFSDKTHLSHLGHHNLWIFALLRSKRNILNDGVSVLGCLTFLIKTTQAFLKVLHFAIRQAGSLVHMQIQTTQTLQFCFLVLISLKSQKVSEMEAEQHSWPRSSTSAEYNPIQQHNMEMGFPENGPLEEEGIALCHIWVPAHCRLRVEEGNF